MNDLLEQLERLIQIMAKQASVPGMDWEDVAQELRILVCARADKITNGKSSPRTYCNKIFRMRIRQLHRNMTKTLRVRSWISFSHLPDNVRDKY